MARNSTAKQEKREMRPRQSIDYSAAQAPGTPKWLKKGSIQGHSEANPQNVNKENAKPQPVTKEKRASKATTAVQEEAPEKKAKAAGSHSQRVRERSSKDTSSQATKEAARAEKEDNVQQSHPAADIPPKIAIGPAKSKQRRSAPEAKLAQANKGNGRKSAPAAPDSKRRLPEHEAEHSHGKNKKAKTSQRKSSEAQAAALSKVDAAKRGAAAQTGTGGTDSWSSGEELRHGKETQPVPLSGKDAHRSSAAQPAEPAGGPELGKAEAQEQPSRKPGQAAGKSHEQADNATDRHKAAVPKEQPSRPGDEQEGRACDDFQKLQGEYAVLQKKYQAIKQQRMEELEALMTEQQQRALEHREAALKLAEHWKEEAIKQARFAQEAGSEEYRRQRKALQAESREARQQLLEAEAALVQEQGVVAELQHLLALAERRAETPPKAHCGTQVTPRAGGNMGSPLTQQLVGSNTPSCISAIRDAYKSGTKAPTSSAPPARTHTPLYLQEAHALCPEGADISETYRKPAHIPGTSAGAANFIASPAGVAQSGTRAPASPPVMFSENASIYQPRSRFAQEAAAPALQAPGEAAGINVHVSAEKDSGAAQRDARVHSEQQKGASAPAVLTRQSWPGLVKDGQQPVQAPADAMDGQEGGQHGGEGPESTTTQKALDTLAGLQSERLGGGGFRFTHRGTGYSFEIRSAEMGSAAQDEVLVPGQQDLAFIPVAFGQAAQILPGYLTEEIVFSAAQKQKLVGRIMEALGTYTLRQAEQGQ